MDCDTLCDWVKEAAPGAHINREASFEDVVTYLREKVAITALADEIIVFFSALNRAAQHIRGDNLDPVALLIRSLLRVSPGTTLNLTL